MQKNDKGTETKLILYSELKDNGCWRVRGNLECDSYIDPVSKEMNLIIKI